MPLTFLTNVVLHIVFIYTDILRMIQQTKETLVQFTDTTGPDLPVHSARLIRAFVICLQNQWLLLYMLMNKSDCMDGHDKLDCHCLHLT